MCNAYLRTQHMIQYGIIVLVMKQWLQISHALDLDKNKGLNFNHKFHTRLFNCDEQISELLLSKGIYEHIKTIWTIKLEANRKAFNFSSVSFSSDFGFLDTSEQVWFSSITELLQILTNVFMIESIYCSQISQLNGINYRRRPLGFGSSSTIFFCHCISHVTPNLLHFRFCLILQCCSWLSSKVLLALSHSHFRSFSAHCNVTNYITSFMKRDVQHSIIKQQFSERISISSFLYTLHLGEMAEKWQRNGLWKKKRKKEME